MITSGLWYLITIIFCIVYIPGRRNDDVDWRTESDAATAMFVVWLLSFIVGYIVWNFVFIALITYYVIGKSGVLYKNA